MGHSRAQKLKTHERIVQVASRRLREKGLGGVGVAEVMKEAGLTVGGFYKHFGSREALISEAVGSCLGSWKRRRDEAAAGGPAFTYETLVDDYLSAQHRDRPGTGCVISALGGEVPRSNKQTRAQISEQIRNNIELIAELLPDKNKARARSKAILTHAALIGALTLARDVSDEKLSQEILKTVATELKQHVS